MLSLSKKIAVALLPLFLPVVASADLQGSINDVTQLGKDAGFKKEFTSFPDLITQILGFLLGFMSIIAVIVLVYAGFKYITSLGDEKKAEEAKHTILFAVIGLIVIGMAALITNTVISFFLTNP